MSKTTEIINNNKENECVELVCQKNGNTQKRIIRRIEIKDKMQIALRNGWLCTAYQINYYKS